MELYISVARHINHWSESQLQFDSSAYPLIETLRRNPHLRTLPEIIVFQGVEGYDWLEDDDGPGSNEDEAYEIFGPLVEFLSADTVVVLRNLAQFWEVDYAIRLAQDRMRKMRDSDGMVPQTMPVVRMVANESPSDYPEIELSAAYEGYHSDNHRVCDEWEKVLGQSHDSLRRLEIPFEYPTSLSQFHRLQHLTLRLPSAISSEEYLATLFGNLQALLSGLGSLSTLILTVGRYRSLFMTNLIKPDSRPLTLPPNLSALSLEFSADPADILLLLKSLSESTSLVRLNLRAERDKAKEVTDECRKRGIDLSFNEYWGIWWENGGSIFKNDRNKVQQLELVRVSD